MGIETYGSKSVKWRVYYGILVLFLNSTVGMWYALMTGNNSR